MGPVLPIIVAIDPGTHCGYAVRYPTGTYDSGNFDLTVKKGEGGGMRFVRFRRKFDDLISTLQDREAPTCLVVVFENVRRHMGTDAAHVYGGIVAHLTAFCEEAQIPYQGIAVGTIKKTATGKGNADKAQMVDAARKRWPDANISDDNEADARWIAETAVAERMV